MTKTLRQWLIIGAVAPLVCFAIVADKTLKIFKLNV